MAHNYMHLDVEETHAIVTGSLDNGGTSEQYITANGSALVQVSSPLLPFGALHTENFNILVQEDAVMGINPIGIETEVVGTGAVTTVNRMFEVSTGAAANSRAVLKSRKTIAYRPGQGLICMFTAMFPASAANSNQIIGFSNEENVLGIGYKNTTFGLHYKKFGKREIQTLTITVASTTAENATVTLDGTAYSVAVTNSASTARTAYEISRGTFGGWEASASGATVTFIAEQVGNKTGTFSIAGTTVVGTFAETVAGAACTDNFVAITSFNGDKLDGTGSSGFTLNPATLNIFRLGVQYLGVGVLTLDIETISSSGRTQWTRAHTVLNPNTLTIPNFSNPNMEFAMIQESLGSTTDLKSYCVCFCGGIEGSISPIGNRVTVTNTITTVGATNFQVLFSIRNDIQSNGLINRNVLFARSIGLSLKHTQPCVFYIIRNGILAGTVNFATAYTGALFSIDTGATTVTTTSNAQFIWAAPVGDTGQIIHTFANPIRINHGEVITVCAKATTGNPAYVTASLNLREDQ